MEEGDRTLTWRPAARADISSVLSYYVESAGVHTAIRVLHKIKETSNLLRTHPFAGKSREEIRPGLRSFLVGTHVIFYCVTKQSVEITRILDGRLDIGSFDL